MIPLLPAGCGASASSPIPAQAGIGLRLPHHTDVLAGAAKDLWLEVHPENYGPYAAVTDELAWIRRDHPLSLHAVSLSLGSAGGLDQESLDALAALARRLEPGLISDHLSWSVAGGVGLPDLLPIPYTDEALKVVLRNIDRAQTVLGRRLLIENPSAGLKFAGSGRTEAQFLGELARRSGCGVLLDVNNVFVSARNLAEDPQLQLCELLDQIPNGAIGEIHLAGHAERRLDGGGVLRIDDHGSPVRPEVWALYQQTIERLGATPTLIEWDTAIPSVDALLAEATTAQDILEGCTEGPRRALG
jgi:uncharacterized protein (UPF0276 family)